MAMVSNSQARKMNGSSLQSLQLPSMTVTQDVTKKLRIKLPTKKVEVQRGTESCESRQRVIVLDECKVQRGTESCESRQRVIVLDECRQSISGGGSKNSTKKSDFVHSSDDSERGFASATMTVKIPVPGSRKRLQASGVPEVQNLKRRKMDRNIMQQCGKILKTLMTHPSGWGFLVPVDPVAYGIPDYFSIISHPMDLGTIKTKLENNEYFDAEEFAADVRLTFSNAMTYNPPGNQFYEMAKQMDNIFSRSWKVLEVKWNQGRTNVKQRLIKSGNAENSLNARKTSPKKSQVRITILPKKTSVSSGENKKLIKDLAESLRGKMTEHLHRFLRKSGLEWSKEETIEEDISFLDDETLSELKRLVKVSLNMSGAKVEPAKITQNVEHPFAGKSLSKDGGNRSACCSAKTKPPSNVVTSMCGSCGGVTCQCHLRNYAVNASSSDLSSERSFGRDLDVCKGDSEMKEKPTYGMNKSDLDSDGAVSTLDDEHFLSSQRSSYIVTAAAAGEAWAPLIDVQLSPKKALRAAMLKSRFADTIFKAKQKTLLDQGEADPMKLQEEKERLKRQQREEKAKIEAQIKAAEAASRMRAEAEVKLQRDKAREAARLALEKMERTVDIDDNQVILKDLDMLAVCSPASLSLEADSSCQGLGAIEGRLIRNPLERLGLFIKEDYCVGDEYEEDEPILAVDGEEGEIL